MMPAMTVLKHVWVPLVIVVAVAVAGFTVDRLRQVFGAHDTTSAGSARSEAIKPFNPKRVTMEVFGPAGAVASINYLDVNAVPQRVDDVALPWTYSVTTTAPAVSVNVVAQGDSDVIGCRILVDDHVEDERSANGVDPQTFCLVKSA
jgi:hypothetical protein